MTTFYLQFSPSQNRLIINNKLSSENELKDTTEANSWLQAKYNLGFPLTSYQEYLLDNQE